MLLRHGGDIAAKHGTPLRMFDDTVQQPISQTSDKKLTFSWSGITERDLEAANFPISGKEQKRRCRRAMLSELLFASRQGSWLCYSRRKGHYSVLRAYSRLGFTYSNTLAVVEELIDAGWSFEERSRPGDLFQQSRLAATSHMIEQLYLCRQLVHNPVEPILLKDAYGEVMSYSDTEKTRGWRRQVQTLNEAFASVRIELERKEGPLENNLEWLDPGAHQFSRVRGYRVFNDGSWKRGGRLYGPFWQLLPKAIRSNLAIDGCRVEEPDFAQIHPVLLYALNGKELHGDAYTLAGHEEDRALFKLAWQMLVNANSRRSATLALMGNANCSREKAREVLRLIEERHEPVRDAFYSGVGLALQALDADLMMRIELEALKAGIVALPIHDSFLVSAGRSAEKVREIMDDKHAQLLARLSS